MTNFQRTAIAFCKAHSCIATAQRDGSILIYSPATQRTDRDGRPCRDGEYTADITCLDWAHDASEVRGVLGY